MEGLICLPCTSLPLNFHIILTEHRNTVSNSQIVLFCSPHPLTSAKFCLKGKLYSRGGAGQNVYLSNTCLLRAVLADEVSFLIALHSFIQKEIVPWIQKQWLGFFLFFPLSFHVFFRLQVQPHFLSVKDWVSMIFDTLLVIVDSHYQPRGHFFSSFYHVSLRNKKQFRNSRVDSSINCSLEIYDIM